MDFTVKTEIFEGPLDLLLSLIEKRKLFINEISLAKIADDFIAYVRKVDQFPIADSAEFILIASTLVLIKSKSLLPSLSLSEEEKGDISNLEERLKIYKRMKELSLHIKEHFGKQIIFESEGRRIELVFSPDQNMTKENFWLSIKEVLKNLPKKEFLPKVVVDKVVSLEKMIESLTERIKSSIKMSFREFSKMGKESKVNVIVSFLAMLELVKQGIVNVVQENKNTDIMIETVDINTPRYT
ncbi:MAG: ScpA family protein [Candidatus Paceibacterota bacterium]